MVKEGKNNKTKIITVVVTIVILFVLLVYSMVAVYFKDRFLFGTKVNGMKVSCKTVKQVEDMISSQLLDYSIKINERNDNSEVIFGSDIGLENTFDDTLSNYVKKQNTIGWIVSLFKKKDVELEKLIVYDKMKYEDVVSGLMCLSDESRIVQPVDAHISDYSDGQYTVVPEEQGSLVNKDRLKETLDSAILSLSEEVDIDAAGCYEAPQITSEDENLKNMCDILNKYVSADIRYTFGDKIEEVNGDMISEWVSYEDGNVTLNDTAIANYIQSLASKYNTIFTNRKFKTSYGQTVTVEGGDYGWWMDQITESQKLKDSIIAGEQVTREPEYKQTAESHGDKDYGSTYVEINITAQHLYFYVDGKLIIESDFVSGTETNGHATPSGTYSITYKERDATLNGENYSTPVSYWMPFNMDIGLHDAGWRSKFGGFIYQKSGSHGCINLPPDVAKTIFQYIEKGDPVIVYRLPGTENKEALAQENAKSVIALIKAIGEVTLESENDIKTARSKYDALSDTAKKCVTNIDTLVNAEEQLKALKETPAQ